MPGDGELSAAELPAQVAKVEAENQLLRVKNAHLLNLLTESCSNCQSLSATLNTLDQQVTLTTPPAAAAPSHTHLPVRAFALMCVCVCVFVRPCQPACVSLCVRSCAG